MIAMIITTVTFLAGAYIAYKALLALNKMTATTRHVIRAAHVALASTGMAFMVSCFMWRDVLGAMAALCVALYLAGNRRKGEVENGY